ncbi:glutamate racemase [Albibacterium indicum]|uniref:glutamate racemase n=1 Tax=Albibacterium indicum TaxID=2292082 RepID=UPI000E48E7BF|nr:glutamate racemase [Pedobacter indicus]
MVNSRQGPIGVFDSGYGGLTVFKEIVRLLPEYDYVYLGDNARVPYGTRTFETVYQYTWECTRALFEMDCPLVILACNTASAKALRTIQMTNLPVYPEEKKVLGVIRPTTERIGEFTKTKHVGILATPGTVKSESYRIEIEKFFPEIQVYQEACPIWVSLVESNEIDTAGAAYFVKKHIDQLLKQSPLIDTIILACTHYPLLYPLIRKFTPSQISVIEQGELVAESLKEYLTRHHELNTRLTKGGTKKFYTTENPRIFNEKGGIFFGKEVYSTQIFV